jgi:uncharacterized membrane protein HdeD (DUF308 family)
MAQAFLTRDEELQLLRRSWGWFAGFGAALIVVGILAIGYPVVATLATVEIVGFFLIAAAAFQFATAVWARRWGGFFLHLLTGLLYLFLGVLMIEQPGLGAAGYTLVLALFFVASGLFRVIFALDRVSPVGAGRCWAALSRFYLVFSSGGSSPSPLSR